MNNLHAIANQKINELNKYRTTYIAQDGMLKYCINAPLLELPVDFKEWYKPVCSNSAVLKI